MLAKRCIAHAMPGVVQAVHFNPAYKALHSAHCMAALCHGSGTVSSQLVSKAVLSRHEVQHAPCSNVYVFGSVNASMTKYCLIGKVLGQICLARIGM
jgi:hypothetical protein